MKRKSTYAWNIYDKQSGHKKKIIRHRNYIHEQPFMNEKELWRVNRIYRLESVYNPLRYEWMVLLNRGSRL